MVTKRTLRIRKRHVADRGTTVFVVVLVVTLLTAVGLFAARVTGSVDSATGYTRQSAQAKALALFAGQMSAAVLANDKDSIAAQMDLAKSSAANTQCPTNRYLPNVECAVRNQDDLNRVSTRSLGPVTNILIPQSESVHGSLGPRTSVASLKGLEGNLRAEYFERVAAPPLAGFSKGSNDAGASPTFEYGVTASAQIRPLLRTVTAGANSPWCSPDAEASNANVQTLRMYVTVP